MTTWGVTAEHCCLWRVRALLLLLLMTQPLMGGGSQRVHGVQLMAGQRRARQARGLQKRRQGRAKPAVTALWPGHTGTRGQRDGMNDGGGKGRHMH
jgi:hypothetical protein